MLIIFIYNLSCQNNNLEHYHKMYYYVRIMSRQDLIYGDYESVPQNIEICPNMFVSGSVVNACICPSFRKRIRCLL